MENNTKPGTPVVIITGASSGIGETAAITLANKGYRVVIAARRKDRLEVIAQQIRKIGGEVLPLQLDLSQVGQIRDLVERTRNVFGRIDVLVNNAGSARHLWLDEQSLEIRWRNFLSKWLADGLSR